MRHKGTKWQKHKVTIIPSLLPPLKKGGQGGFTLCLCACLLLAGCSGGGGGGGDTTAGGMGKIQITADGSEPSTITLDGTTTGKTTPATLDVASGTHHLVVTQPGRSWEKDVVVGVNEVAVVHATFDYTSTPPPFRH